MDIMDLNCIKDNYCIIQRSIKELQKYNLFLADLLLAFDQVRLVDSECNSDNIK